MPNPWQYAGQYRDGTGLYKIGARYYDASIGRWTQQDSIVTAIDPKQANRYIYVGDDPTNYTDASGNISWDDVHNFAKATGDWVDKHRWQTALTVGKLAVGCTIGGAFGCGLAFTTSFAALGVGEIEGGEGLSNGLEAASALVDFGEAAAG